MNEGDRNPLIAADAPIDTLGNVCAVVDFLRWVESGEFGSDPGDSATMGRHLIFRSITSAVWSLEPHLRKLDRVAKAA